MNSKVLRTTGFLGKAGAFCLESLSESSCSALSYYGHIVERRISRTPGPLGNRFNGPERGAWYAGFSRKTSEIEVAYHRSQGNSKRSAGPKRKVFTIRGFSGRLPRENFTNLRDRHYIRRLFGSMELPGFAAIGK